MKQILIDTYHGATRTACLHDGRLTELQIDPPQSVSLEGHIFVGHIKNILPGQMAFVDIGQPQNAFVNLRPSQSYRKGQPLLLQIRKDANGNKGPQGDETLRLRGRWVILFASPRGEVGVSGKLDDTTERARLRKAVKTALPKGYGAIVRTAAQGRDETALAEEVAALTAQLAQLHERAAFARPPVLLHAHSSFTDLLTHEVDEVWTAGAKLRHEVQTAAPFLTDRVHLYEAETPDLFDAYGVPAQINAALRKEVPLPSGGYITIEPTEALVVVDVNTAGFSRQEKGRTAAMQTNLEAAVIIPRQLAVRNLSGIIIIDFIDMKDRADKQALLDTLAAEIKKDRIKTELVGMTELGLVQLTRRKTRPPLHITWQTHTKTP